MTAEPTSNLEAIRTLLLAEGMDIPTYQIYMVLAKADAVSWHQEMSLQEMFDDALELPYIAAYPEGTLTHQPINDNRS